MESYLGYYFFLHVGNFSKKMRTFMIASGIITIVSIMALSHISILSSPSGPQPFGQSGTWHLVFDDEFNGTSLDTTKWVPCFYWGDSTGCGSTTTPQNWYLPGNVIVSNGTLKLQTQNRPVTENGTTYPYTSGMITTGPWDSTHSPAKFAFTYGYMEIRAKVPKGQGLWPAFWALPADTSELPEIDVSEILTGAGATTYTNSMTYHYSDETNHRNYSSGRDWTSPVDLASDFHIYAVDWEPDGIHWYVDGIERRLAFTESKNIAAKPMYLLIQLEVGGTLPGSPDSKTPFPSIYEIDYARVWQR
jgi:beta-glucanase (GH16 family)